MQKYKTEQIRTSPIHVCEDIAPILCKYWKLFGNTMVMQCGVNQGYPRKSAGIYSPHMGIMLRPRT